MRAAENVWAIGDVTGIAPFTHVGKYHARIAAYDMAGRDAKADHRAVPATIFTDPQVATVGDTTGGVSSTWELTSVPRLSTYERPKRKGFVKVVADPERRVLTGAVAVGPESGEWLQQLTLAIREPAVVHVVKSLRDGPGAAPASATGRTRSRSKAAPSFTTPGYVGTL